MTHPARNIPGYFARGTVIPCNDNIHVDVMPSGCFVSTTGRTEGFTQVLEAKFYIDSYYEGMATMNGLNASDFN